MVATQLKFPPWLRKMIKPDKKKKKKKKKRIPPPWLNAMTPKKGPWVANKSLKYLILTSTPSYMVLFS
jgi:hypothetical protein